MSGAVKGLIFISLYNNRVLDLCLRHPVKYHKSLKRMPHTHIQHVLLERNIPNFTQKFKFYAVSLKIRVNQSIMKVYGKKIICI